MDTKVWYQSLTIWGTTLLTICGVILPLIGQADLAKLIENDKVNIINVLAGIGSLIGAIVAIYGRITAKTVLTLTK